MAMPKYLERMIARLKAKGLAETEVRDMLAGVRKHGRQQRRVRDHNDRKRRLQKERREAARKARRAKKKRRKRKR